MFKCLDYDQELSLRPNYLASLRIFLIACDQLANEGYEPSAECIADKE